MPCYHPLATWMAKSPTVNGKRGITFNFNEGYKDRPREIPCGRCIGCRLERSRQWAIRCVHEAQLHERNCFVTLTYENAELPRVAETGAPTLRPRDFVLFMKKLRKRHGKVRFFHCGEYGEKLARPHHHALLFGHDFDDRRLHSYSGTARVDTSEELQRLWPQGFSTVGEATFESAAYVARYILKKVTGPQAAEHYQGRTPEYVTMSRRPGIGKEWIMRFMGDVYPHDNVVIRGGVKCKPAKYYDQQLEKTNPGLMQQLKEARKLEGMFNPDSTGKRLVVREECRNERIKTLTRSTE